MALHEAEHDSRPVHISVESATRRSVWHWKAQSVDGREYDSLWADDEGTPQ
jgi:hypothetical protein